MTTEKLLPLTVRLETVVADALRFKAASAGQEAADYAASLLTEGLMDVIRAADAGAARRLQAELEIKARAIMLARQFSPADRFDPNVTLKVFQAIRHSGDLNEIYIRAIGGKPGNERGNPIKARINRSLGAIVKTAVQADVETIGDNPVKVQVSGEFIFSYTLLKPSSGKARTHAAQAAAA